MEAYEQLKLIRGELNVTQKEFAAKVGVPASTISNIENGSREIPKSLMRQLVEDFNINAKWLLTGEGDMFESGEKEVSESPAKIPLLGQTVSCGPGDEWQDSDTVEQYVEPLSALPSLRGRKVYAFRARGTSMVGAGIMDGDIVLFDGDRSQDPLDDIYVFALEQRVYCKLVKYDQLSGRVRIYSMHSGDIKEAELVREIDLNDPAQLEAFHPFGRVLAWMHENRIMYR